MSILFSSISTFTFSNSNILSFSAGLSSIANIYWILPPGEGIATTLSMAVSDFSLESISSTFVIAFGVRVIIDSVVIILYIY